MDYYVCSLWNSSLCRQYSCVETGFITTIKNQFSLIIVIKSIKWFHCFMNNSLLTEVKGICAKLACGIHFFCIISVDLTVKTTVAIIMSVILKGIVWISVHLRETPFGGLPFSCPVYFGIQHIIYSSWVSGSLFRSMMQ